MFKPVIQGILVGKRLATIAVAFITNALLGIAVLAQDSSAPPVPMEPERAALAWDAAAVTAVVYNSAVPESERLARLYATGRGIPPSNIVALEASTEEDIQRTDFESTIRDPLKETFKERGWLIPEEDGGGSKIRILVLMYGMPLRVMWRPNDPVDGQVGTSASSVDSELTLLAATDYELRGSIPNPYFKKDLRFADFPDKELILTARIDGPDPATVRRMIDGPRSAEAGGLWGMAYIDLSNDRRPGYAVAEGWLKDARKSLRAEGIPVVTEGHETRYPINYPLRDPIFYLGWYTNHLEGAFLKPDFRFPPGAIAIHIHSYSAASLRKEGKHWVGPLLERGAAATVGNVFEPFLGATTHLHVLTDRLLAGYTLAEAAWMATPALSWMNIVAGDPLYRPYGTGRGLDDRDRARPYKISHLLARSHGTADPVPLLKALTEAGEAQGLEPIPVLLETAGLILRDRGDDQRALSYFEHSASVSTLAGDRIRNQLHAVDIYRTRGERNIAVSILQAMLSAPADDPSIEAVRALKNELDPPPPPQPANNTLVPEPQVPVGKPNLEQPSEAAEPPGGE